MYVNVYLTYMYIVCMHGVRVCVCYTHTCIWHTCTLNTHVLISCAWCARMCVLHTYMHMAYMHIEYTCTMMYTHIYTTVCVCVYIHDIVWEGVCTVCEWG